MGTGYKYYDMEAKSSRGLNPWSFSGIMAEIQGQIYNGYGIDESYIEYHNLIGRIDSLKPDERERAYSELSKAKELAKAKSDRFKEEYDAKTSAEKEAAENSYRAAWKKKGLFYKLTNKRKNPKNINFDDLNTSHINAMTRVL